MNMTEPSATGIGGDMFVLYWDAATKQVKSINGSGRSGARYSIDSLRQERGLKDGDVGQMPRRGGHAVTVPGAAAGWCDTVERLGSGKLTLAQILAPAIKLGEKGFPVSEVTSQSVRAFFFLNLLGRRSNLNI